MDKGTYTGRRVNFSKYAVSSFTPHLFTGDVRAGLGCGFAALALLTGTAPEVIAAKRRSSHCSDDFMLRYLRGKGIRTLQLTQCNLSSSQQSIRVDHVLLLSQLFRRNEGTWIVLFNDWGYHNFQLYSMGTLSFINKPLLSAYVVCHPRWRLHVPPVRPARPGRSAKGVIASRSLFPNRSKTQ